MSAPVASVDAGPLDAAALLASVPTPADGAVLLFVGVVREENEGRAVTHLHYDAYREMAERTLEAIVAEARARWEVGEVRVAHRVGRLEVGEASVAIAVAAPHRDAAYQASRYVIEELKKRAPIWKREGYADGAAEWLPGADPLSAEPAHE
jgi:molybdopterin synthase catalytic subunit